MVTMIATMMTTMITTMMVIMIMTIMIKGSALHGLHRQLAATLQVVSQQQPITQCFQCNALRLRASCTVPAGLECTECAFWTRLARRLFSAGLRRGIAAPPAEQTPVQSNRPSASPPLLLLLCCPAHKSKRCNALDWSRVPCTDWR